MRAINRHEIVVMTHYIEDWYPNGLTGVFISLKRFDIKELHNVYLKTHDEDGSFEKYLIENGYIQGAYFRQINTSGEITEENHIRERYENVHAVTKGEQ
jgi:hypothetical protein